VAIARRVRDGTAAQVRVRVQPVGTGQRKPWVWQAGLEEVGHGHAGGVGHRLGEVLFIIEQEFFIDPVGRGRVRHGVLLGISVCCIWRVPGQGQAEGDIVRIRL
jgi:hypothetical protein